MNYEARSPAPRRRQADIVAFTETQIAETKDNGVYQFPHGLKLIVRWPSKVWRLVCSERGRRSEVTIGRYPQISVADAMKMRDQIREAKAQHGTSAKALLGHRLAPGLKPLTFDYDVLNYRRERASHWKDGGFAWEKRLKDVPSLFTIYTHLLTEQDILDAIRPIWISKNPTARVILQQVKTVYEWARQTDPHRMWRPDPFRDVINKLPAVDHTVENFNAMPWQELPAFYRLLSTQNDPPALALRFLLLCCCPNVREVIYARWEDIDWSEFRYVIPAIRSRSNKMRAVPLSNAAVGLLLSVPQPHNGLIFRSETTNDRIYAGKVLAALQDLTMTDYTVSGFRYTIAAWVNDNLTFDDLPTLRHCLGQGDVIDKPISQLQQRIFVEKWAAFLTGG